MDATPAAPEIKEAERQIARIPLVLNRRNFSWLTERISGVVELPAPRWWWVTFTITASIAMFGLFCLGYQISTGVGTWGSITLTAGPGTSPTSCSGSGSD